MNPDKQKILSLEHKVRMLKAQLQEVTQRKNKAECEVVGMKAKLWNLGEEA